MRRTRSREQGIKGSGALRAQRERVSQRLAPRSFAPALPRSSTPAVLSLRRGAFTLIELLIVIAVIGLLIGVIAVVGSKVMYGQKVRLTQTTMRAIKIAIDQFAAEDPLRSIYNKKGNAAFGPYPPYTLAEPMSGKVNYLVEAQGATGWDHLGVRLAADLSGDRSTPAEPGPYVDIEQGNRNDDIRALYAYLAVYAKGELSQIPTTAIKRLPDRVGTPIEMVNPAGTGTGSGAPVDGPVDILGFYDAWGVPMDYYLHVKLEYDAIESKWRVTDRVPVLRSLGITKEEFDADPTALDVEKWMFSEPFPTPACPEAYADTGVLNTPPSVSPQNPNGWVRAKAANETYKYLPPD